jgi:hypothetical protein
MAWQGAQKAETGADSGEKKGRVLEGPAKLKVQNLQRGTASSVNGRRKRRKTRLIWGVSHGSCTN